MQWVTWLFCSLFVGVVAGSDVLSLRKAKFEKAAKLSDELKRSYKWMVGHEGQRSANTAFANVCEKIEREIHADGQCRRCKAV